MAIDSWKAGTDQLPNENWDQIWGVIAEKIPALKPYVQQMSGWNHQTTELLRSANRLLVTAGVNTGIEEAWALSETEELESDQFPSNDWPYKTLGTANGVMWVSAKPAPTLDDPYLQWVIRTYNGEPDIGDEIPARWSDPIVVQRHASTDATGSLLGQGFEIIFIATALRVPPDTPATTQAQDATNRYLPDGWSFIKPVPTEDLPFVWFTFRFGSSHAWSKYGPVREADPSFDQADPDLYPFSHALRYDLRQLVFGAAVDPGEYILRDSEGNALSDPMSGVKISWAEVANAAAYQFRLKLQAATEWGEWMRTVTTSVFLSRDDGLVTNERYDFEARALDSADNPGRTSTTVNFQFL